MRAVQSERDVPRRTQRSRVPRPRPRGGRTHRLVERGARSIDRSIDRERGRKETPLPWLDSFQKSSSRRCSGRGECLYGGACSCDACFSGGDCAVCSGSAACLAGDCAGAGYLGLARTATVTSVYEGARNVTLTVLRRLGLGGTVGALARVDLARTTAASPAHYPSLNSSAATLAAGESEGSLVFSLSQDADLVVQQDGCRYMTLSLFALTGGAHAPASQPAVSIEQFLREVFIRVKNVTANRYPRVETTGWLWTRGSAGSRVSTPPRGSTSSTTTSTRQTRPRPPTRPWPRSARRERRRKPRGSATARPVWRSW